MITEPPEEPRKFYIDGGEVEVIGHLVYDLDTDGKKLQVVRYTDYSGRAVRTLYPTRDALQSAWANPDTRAEVLRELTERGISFEELAASSDQPDADPFDMLCHLAWNAPLLTRRQRAERAKRQTQDLFAQYGDTAVKSWCCYSTSTSSAALSNSMCCRPDEGAALRPLWLPFRNCHAPFRRCEGSERGRIAAAVSHLPITRTCPYGHNRQTRRTRKESAPGPQSQSTANHARQSLRLDRHRTQDSAQGQRPEWRRGSPAIAHLGHVPQVSRRPRSCPRRGIRTRRQTLPAHN
jgi:hypothetical protein